MGKPHIRRAAIATLLIVQTLLVVPSSTQTPGQPRPPATDVNSRHQVRLPDGRLLQVGGVTASGAHSAISIFDPHTKTWSRVPADLGGPRQGHTVTLLPDGMVLILGGRGRGDALNEPATLFDPTSLQVLSAPFQLATNRAYHSTTVLTDGRVLVVGGIDQDGTPLGMAEIWNPASNEIALIESRVRRAHHAASLTADGSVRLTDGIDELGQRVSLAELYNPAIDAFVDGAAISDFEPTSIALAGSIPADGAGDVSVDIVIALRFSQPLAVASVNPQTVRLVEAHQQTIVPAKVVPVESGRLVFVHPVEPLQPGQLYSVLVQNAHDPEGRPAAWAAISFITADSSQLPEEDDDAWQPNLADPINGWRTGRGPSPWESLPPLQARPGVTALSGRVLRLNGQPLPGVGLSIDDHKTFTDRTGRFLLQSLPEGRHELIIDGRSAGSPGRTYGVFEVGVDILTGRTNVLSYTSWMPRIDTGHALRIQSPTASAVTVRSPYIPGLELHIPAGAVIEDVDDRVATEISITPIPVDRPPFPLPSGVYVPIYFTIQPGAGYVYTASGQPLGTRLFYPNYRNEEPGKRFDFWHYDPEERGWYVYGEGAVESTRRQIVPDPGVEIYEFTGAMVANPSFAPAEGPAPCNECVDGEPVDLGTGLFVMSKTDLLLPDVLPLQLTRTYRTLDSRVRAFGRGATHPYDIFMVGDKNPWTYQQLILPDGGRVHFRRTSPGTHFTDAIYIADAAPGPFFHAKLGWVGGVGEWELNLKDGTRMTFPDAEFAIAATQGAVTNITDRFGNQVVLTRDAANLNRLTRIGTVNGSHSIDFTYGSNNKITQARDNTGRTVNYEYDAGERLWKVTDVAGGVTEYTYDTSGRMLTIKDPRGIVYLTNEYDINGRVLRQTQADGSTYQFTYTLNAGKVTQTDVTNPRGFVRRVTFNTAGYWMTDKRAVGQPEEQLATVERNPTTNFITAFIDQLGRRTTYAFDTFGNLTAVTKLAGTRPCLSSGGKVESRHHPA